MAPLRLQGNCTVKFRSCPNQSVQIHSTKANACSGFELIQIDTAYLEWMHGRGLSPPVRMMQHHLPSRHDSSGGVLEPDFFVCLPVHLNPKILKVRSRQKPSLNSKIAARSQHAFLRHRSRSTYRQTDAKPQSLAPRSHQFPCSEPERS